MNALLLNVIGNDNARVVLPALKPKVELLARVVPKNLSRFLSAFWLALPRAGRGDWHR